MTRLALVALAAALLAGCGGAGASSGSATLWVTRDEGRTLLVDKTVPAGETALQALDRETDVSTRYGGKFVQSVNGLAGSIAKRHDWFYFVNGIEGSRGAQEYRLHAGDVLWWDYRDWGRYGQSVSAVVGSFPEPFLHGFGGTVPPAVVVGPRTTSVAKVVRLLHATRVSHAGANVLTITPGSPTRFSARANGSTVRFTFVGDPASLLRPAFYRRKYAVG